MKNKNKFSNMCCNFDKYILQYHKLTKEMVLYEQFGKSGKI